MANKKSEATSGALSTRLDGIKGYLEDSRDLFTGVLLVIPLFVFYQVGLLATGGVRNGVDFMTDLLWWIAQGSFLVYVGINFGVLLILGAALFYLRRQKKFRPEIWPLMMAESLVYALFFGAAVIELMSVFGFDALLASGAKDFGVMSSFVLSLGAGLYEETVFRLLGMGGLFALLVRVVKLPSWVSALLALLISSVLFSAIHYIGPMGDPFELGSFLFRFFAGVLLALIFHVRGFAIAVYTHAIYDIIVMVFR